MLPAYKLPKKVRTAMTINASSGEYITKAAKENILESPIFAPGINSGGNRLSIIKVIRLSDVKIASVAILFVTLICLFIRTYYISKFANSKTELGIIQQKNAIKI
jgi:hypothetical protein